MKATIFPSNNLRLLRPCGWKEVYILPGICIEEKTDEGLLRSYESGNETTTGMRAETFCGKDRWVLG